MPDKNNEAAVFELIEMKGRDECWRWKGSWGGRDRNRRPYIQVDGKRWIAYRLVYELVHGRKLTTEELIMHKCDNGQAPIGCCNPYHLVVGNNVENMREMAERQRSGLPRVVIKGIRRLLDKGVSHAEIADLYGIARTTVVGLAYNRERLQLVEEDDEAQTP